MKSFLQQLVAELKDKHGSGLEKLCLVFPTKRAGVFFRKEVSKAYDKPIWSPRITSIRDFINDASGLEIPDSLTLLFTLYNNYKRYYPDEDFAQFYSWGELLLKDFDDIDKYLINAQKLFTTVTDLHQIDAEFALEAEDLERLRAFWKNFFDRDPSLIRNRFIDTWKNLWNVYSSFQKELIRKNLAYEGMIYRKLAEEIQTLSPRLWKDCEWIIFAGFYAFTPSEQTIVNFLVGSGKATVYWDADTWYVDDVKQEAGRFFRELKPNMGLTNWKQENFKNIRKEIEMAGIPLQVGQARYACNVLDKLMASEDFDSERTVIVLPDEKLLFPVLYSLPGSLKDINVTMGYPLKQTPLYNLFDALLSLKKNERFDDKGLVSYYFRDVSEVLNHPYIRQLADGAIRNWQTGLRKNYIRISRTDLLILEKALFPGFFDSTNSMNEIFDWFRKILLAILETMKENDFQLHRLESEFIYQFYTSLSRLEDLLKENDNKIDLDTFWKIFSEIISSVKIPFSGEPLRGLQIMGFLETRVLDFDNVIILSMNEDILPASGFNPSYIPFSIRKAFGLPTYEENHAVSAYHFYRLLQRARKIFLVHNTELRGLTTGERSRFLLQIENELQRKYPGSISIKHKVISTPAVHEKIEGISIRKNESVMDELSRFISDNGAQSSSLSPSALIAYIACPLRFYFRYVARLKEKEEPEEHMEAATFGKVLHKAMQLLYSNIGELTMQKIEKLKQRINDCVDEAIHAEFVSVNQLEGKNILLRNVIRELINRIIDSEKPHLPIRILQLEKDVSGQFQLEDGRNIRLYGIIDRVDEQNDVLRIIDYKTGKVIKKKHSEIDAFFVDPAYKEQFQAMYYAYLTSRKMQGRSIKSGLLMMRDMAEGIWFMNSNNPYTDEQFQDFEINLRKLIGGIFDPEIPFSQTQDEVLCHHCDFKSICNRQ